MLIKHKTVLEIWNLPNNRGTGYEEGAADLIIRLFSANVGWVHGESLQAIRRQLEEVRGLQLRSKFSADFAVYAERLSWKVDCLIRLLSARADRSSQRIMDASVDPNGDLDVAITFPSEAHFSEELGLRLLVQRLRLGCHTAAIPILWKRSANVRRADATEYLSHGWSPVDILRDFEFSKFNGGGWSAPGTLTSIHQVVSDYVLKQFHTLATEFMMRGGEGQSHQDPGLVLWQWLDEKSGIESFMEQYHLGNPNRDFADYAWDRFQPSIEVDRERAVDDGTSSDALLLATDQTDEASYSLALHHGTNGALVLREHIVTLSDSRRQQSQKTKLTKFLFVGTTSDWKTADKSLDQILQAEEGTDRLIVVFVPWMPPATSCPPAIAAEFDKRFRNPSYVTACMTLSAFAVLISALGRRFMPPEHLLATLFSKNHEGTIGLSSLYRAMAPFSGFPVPLKEALLRCSDVEVASNLPRSQTAKGHASEAGALEKIVVAEPDGMATSEASE